MIKYIQKLKAKKGFTLVELIVVIAIIGVLAAILIPTMLGYVTQSKVTSANSTAASIKNEIDAFLTQCDTNNYGMKKASTNFAVFEFKIDQVSSKTEWLCTNSDENCFADKDNWKSSAATKAYADGSKADTNHLIALGVDLAQLFPEVKVGYITANLVGGKCIGVTYQNSQNAATAIQGGSAKKGSTYEYIITENNKWPAGYVWSDDTQGIDIDGVIVGTAPVIQLADRSKGEGKLSS